MHAMTRYTAGPARRLSRRSESKAQAADQASAVVPRDGDVGSAQIEPCANAPGDVEFGLHGVPVRLGHASTHVTADIDQHVLLLMQDEAVQAVQSLFGATPEVTHDPELQPPETVARIRELYRQGKSYWATAKQLNEEGYRTRRGGKFYHQTVRQIMEDPHYRDLAVDGKA